MVRRRPGEHYTDIVLILALDTASAITSVAVHDGNSVVASAQADKPMSHGESIGPCITQVLHQGGVQMTDVTDIAAGVGPGPFTGLRVGIMTALALAETRTGASGAGPLRTHGICSLDVLAMAVQAAGLSSAEFLIATDARRKEVYWARYSSAAARVEGPAVATPADVAAWFGDVPVFGRGAMMYADILGTVEGPLDPTATMLAAGVADGRFAGGEMRPMYLRRPDAKPLPQL